MAPMTLQQAIDLATRKHEGKSEKAGRPYIEHPLRVMNAVAELGEAAMMAAVLHDVIEDTPTTPADLLQSGCPPEVVRIVEILTKAEDEEYPNFVRRVRDSGDAIAIAVKRADMTDNSDEKRLELLDGDEADRLRKKYRVGFEILDRPAASGV
jgi:(p)ppGpp synthase/HD superfamily hydrolase